MRSFINIVDFGLSYLPEFSSELLNEIEIRTSQFEWRDPFPVDPEHIGEIRGLPVQLRIYQEHYMVSVGDPMLSYAIYRMTPTGWRYLEEMQTREDVRGKGYGADLLVFLVKQEKIIIDHHLSIASANMIEKLIRARACNANIANLETGEMMAYDPDADAKVGMYTTQVSGIDRPVIDEKNGRLTWVLESFERKRGPLLQPL
jgi:GNAT superfamily N-acetyltransferase